MSYKSTLFILISLLLMGCTGKQKSEDFIRPVKVGYALREQGANCEILSGEVSAGMEMNVTFRSPGTLQSVYVKPGSFIKQGTLIASLDAREYELAYDAAKSKYDQVSGEVDRVKELYARNSVAKNDYDKAIAGLETVKALYETAKYQLEDTKLYAPINGYVQSVKVSVGQTITPLTPIINMVETQTLSISTNIPSSLYLRRDSFEHFTATSPLLAGSFPLELQYIAPKANNSQLYRMGLSIVGSVKDLAPGMIVEVRIDYKMPDSDELSVPLSALFGQREISYVWVMDTIEMTVNKRMVDVGNINESGRIVVKSGLQEHEMIVTAGVNRLKEGERVFIESSNKTGNTSNQL